MLYRNFDVRANGFQMVKFTLTGEFKLIDNFFARLEYRRDWLDQAVFERGSASSASKCQDTFFIGIVAYFPPPRK